ncbi:MAG: IS5/IS1182 family transposase, partial [Thiobacillaceae bacterium]
MRTLWRGTSRPSQATGRCSTGSSHFLTKTLEKVKTEMSLHVLAYNMKRMINIFGVRPLMQAN